MKKVLLLKFGELFLKGKNIKQFENRLINNIKEAKSWLTPESVIRYDDNNNFLKDFPERKTLDEHEEEEEL